MTFWTLERGRDAVRNTGEALSFEGPPGNLGVDAQQNGIKNGPCRIIFKSMDRIGITRTWILSAR